MPTFYARHEYTGDGANTNFSVAFPYLGPDHVKVLLNGIESSTWTWFGGSLIVMDTVPASGDAVVIYRDSSRNARLVEFTSPGVTDTVLNTDSLQAFYLAQEAVDTANAVLVSAETLQLDAGDRRLTNVANPVDDQDAATKTWVLNTTAAAIPAADAAAASAAAAAISEANATTSASNAAASETNAASSEINAASSAAAALTSETNAATSASLASGLITFKNKLINPGFKVNQRGTTTINMDSPGILRDYIADRWQAVVWDAAVTFNHKIPTAPHPELTDYIEIIPTRNDIIVQLEQTIEDVRTFDGEDITVSLLLRANADFDLQVMLQQIWGTGSADADVNYFQDIAYTAGGWVNGS